MVWWYMLGGFVLGVLILALAARPLLGRLAALQRAGARLQERVSDAQELQAKAEVLQERMEALAGQAGQMQEQVAARRSR